MSALLVTIAICSHLAADDELPSFDEAAAKYSAIVEASRPAVIADLKTWVAWKKDELLLWRGKREVRLNEAYPADMTPKKRREAIDNAEKEIASAQRRIKELEAKKATPPDPLLRWAVGSGGLLAGSVTVEEVVDADNLIVSNTLSIGTQKLWIARHSTKGINRGDDFPSPRPFLVVGTMVRGNEKMLLLVPAR